MFGYGSVKIKRNTIATLLLIFSLTIIICTGIVSAEEEPTIINNTNTSQTPEPTINTDPTIKTTPTTQTINIKTTNYAAAGTPTFTQQEILNANTWVKNFIEKNKKLPSSVTINKINVNMPSFLKLITTLTLKIKKNDKKNIEYINYGNPKVTPQDTQKTGTMTQAKYLEIAGRIEDYMIRNQKAPPFSSYSPLGKYFGYENLIYTYSKILDNYNTNGQLPASIKIVPWNYVKSYAGKFTIQQTKTAANYLKTYVESNKKLPSSVPITGTDLNGQITNTHITLPAFLKLLTTTTLKIKNNDNTPTTLFNTYKNPTTTPQDTQKTGTMTQAKYIEIAGRIEDYMIRNQKAPPYSSYSPLGKYFGYENLIYTYSKILDNYNTNGQLPASIKIVPWNYVKSYAGKFTIQQTKTAANYLKTYVESNKKLPSSVPITGTDLNGQITNTHITLPAFLKLLTTTTLKIKNNDNTPTTLFNTYKNPTTTPQDTQKTGTMTQAKYIEIAGRIEDYMIRNQKAPPYSSYSPLGKYFGYENLIYTYSKILDTDNPTLPTNVGVYSWNLFCNFLGTFTIQQTTDAATYVKDYVDSEQKLPDIIPMNGSNLQGETVNIQVSLPCFLNLLTSITLKINNNDNTPAELMNYYKNPSAPKDCQRIGYMSLAKYVDIAGRVKDYMDRNHNAPNFSSYSNLGTYFGYENLIYTYSKILDAYSATSKQLPASVEIKLWKAIIDPNGLWRKPVYITCDNIDSDSEDWSMMNSICDYLNNLGLDGFAWGRGPNTHYTILNDNSIPQNALIVDIYGGACAGTIYEMGLSYYKNWKGNLKVFTIFINPPSWDIRKCPTRDIYGRNFLPKAGDDNFSGDILPDWGYNSKGQLVKGLSNPDKYMTKHGYNFLVTSYNVLKISIGIYEQSVL